MKAGELIDHIVSTHHRFVKENTPAIEQMVTKVANRHQQQHPELKQLEAGVLHFLKELQLHLRKEEHILFPAITQLEQQNKDIELHKGIIRSAVKILRGEHESSGEELRTFRELTNGYALPEDACNSYTMLFEMLKRFESDLLIHIHLENNILFPKAVQLEQQLSQ